jgi:hypothetical protein
MKPAYYPKASSDDRKSLADGPIDLNDPVRTSRSLATDVLLALEESLGNVVSFDGSIPSNHFKCGCHNLTGLCFPLYLG